MLEHGELSSTSPLDQGSEMRFLSSAIGSLTWDYDCKSEALMRIYEIAKSKSWNAATKINWCGSVRPAHFPTLEKYDPFAGFGPYDSMPLDERQCVSWWRHSLEVSEILHGEQGALVVSSQLVSCLPTIEAKLFASSQVHDEARHVEFFTRYLSAIGAPIHPPTEHLKTVLNLALNDERWDVKFILCQILIESLALAQFQELRKTTTMKQLQDGLEYIAKDEARHVKFGTLLLKDYLKTLHHDDLEERAELVLNSVFSLSNNIKTYLKIAEAYSWDVDKFRLHIRKYRVLHRDLNIDRFRQLTLNMSSVGLLTDRVIDRLKRIKLFL